MTHVLPRRFATGALSLALLVGGSAGLAACGSDDVSRDRFLEDLNEQSPTTSDLNECVVDELFATLDQAEINEFYSEDPSDPLSDENQAALDAAGEKCEAEATGAATTTAPG